MKTCGRCKKQIAEKDAEFCWYCESYLCYDCWDEFGHCGHVEAEAQNERARLHNPSSMLVMLTGGIAKETKMVRDFYNQGMYLLAHWKEETDKAAKLYAGKIGREPMTDTERKQAWIDYCLARVE